MRTLPFLIIDLIFLTNIQTVNAFFDPIVIIGWPLSIIINVFFASQTRPVLDKLCLDFRINFQLLDIAECFDCNGGVTPTLKFGGSGTCVINNGNDVCLFGVCGKAFAYPTVKTERIDFFALIGGDPDDAVESFEMEATAVLDRLEFMIEGGGSISQCRVDLDSVSATFNGDECTAELIPFTVEDPTCTNNENEPHYFMIDCGDGGPVGATDIAFQDRTPSERRLGVYR